MLSDWKYIDFALQQMHSITYASLTKIHISFLCKCSLEAYGPGMWAMLVYSIFQGYEISLKEWTHLEGIDEPYVRVCVCICACGRAGVGVIISYVESI